MNEVKVDILKLVNGGQGLGFHGGKPVFVWNALPGETAAIRLTGKKRKFLEGMAIRIDNASPERIDPEEEHFISCSPWQIMTFACENHWKKEIAKETFKRMSGIELPDFEIVHNEDLFGYRNKIEYGFCANKGGNAISLALHKRGAADRLPIDQCLLAKEHINKVALDLLERLNREKVDIGRLKSLILREDRGGLVFASLIVTDKKFHLPRSIACEDRLTGIHLYLSNPLSSGPLSLGLLQSRGNDFIIEELAGRKFKCAPLSFFQVNIDIFEEALSRISSFIGDADEVVDFYSGVGAIGIALGDKVKSVLLVENNRETAKLAGENIELNELKNVEARGGSSEDMLGEIKRERTVILDPPRAGLHPRMLEKLLEVLPRQVIYLSCDIATQARDLKMLKQKYEVGFCELYNFFPRTPHIESLLVLNAG